MFKFGQCRSSHECYIGSAVARRCSPARLQTPVLLESPKTEELERNITFPGYLAARYYPVWIGEVFANRYQVVGKLGFGAHSTVWLARDLNQNGHVALKVFVYSQALGDHVNNGIAMYKRMEQCASSHPGRGAVRTLLYSFRVTGPDGERLCGKVSRTPSGGACLQGF
ncbi:hypothetical protein GGR58DRAFT_159396 [Xylaria digitata]|nr:hypothetical protein GGR58DRAFT_159396 [Xylaria digitata]